MTTDLFALRNALETFQRVDAAMPLSAIQALIWVALNDGRHQSDLENALGMTAATASRSVAWWSEWRSLKDNKPGPGYIESLPDPMDKRYRIVRMTKAGRRWLAENFG